jgi:hypothetical protein
MPVSDIMMLSIAAVLTAWLCFRRWRRANTPLPEKNWTGHGIDVAPVSTRVERLRRDFAGELPARPDRSWQRKGLLASTRSAIGQLPYFQRRHAESSNRPEYEPENHAV